MNLYPSWSCQLFNEIQLIFLHPTNNWNTLQYKMYITVHVKYIFHFFLLYWFSKLKVFKCKMSQRVSYEFIILTFHAMKKPITTIKISFQTKPMHRHYLFLNWIANVEVLRSANPCDYNSLDKEIKQFSKYTSFTFMHLTFKE